MRVKRGIALVAIAAVAACSEQTKEVAGPQADLTYVGDVATSWTSACTDATGSLQAFMFSGDQNTDNAKPGSQFGIIGPERTYRLNQGELTSYVARNGVSTINTFLAEINKSTGFSSKVSGIGSYSTKTPAGQVAYVLNANLNGDTHTDYLVLVPTSALVKAGIIGPEKPASSVLLELIHGPSSYRGPGDVQAGGTAPCAPPPPPPPGGWNLPSADHL